MFMTVSLPRIRMNKTETVGWEDFFQKKEDALKGVIEVSILGTASTMIYLLSADHTEAASIKERIISSFDPLIEVIQGLSYPVAFIMISAGFLVIMTGQRQKGLHLLKWAGIGYIGMQLVPALMQILVEVGKSMQN